MNPALIALGSNLGAREQYLDRTLQELAAHPSISRLNASRYHATAPVGGPTNQPEFLNAAATLQTTLAPEELLALLQAIEQAAGRERTVHWGPRTLDLDLLLYADRVLTTPTLTLPHPFLHERRFVLEPAVEVAADWVHPVLGETLQALLDRMD